MLKHKKAVDRSLRWRKLLRLHLSLTVIALGTYATVAIFDPGFLSYDLRQKFHAIADDIVVTAIVLPPPSKPVVTAVSECDETTGTLSVELDWADDTGSTSFDVDRDSSPLVTGLSQSAYSDTLVALSTTYTYEVTANGPMGPGFEVSDPVVVTTLSACEITLAAASVTIVSFDGRGVDHYDGMPRTSNRRPVFSGTTNVANGLIEISVGNDARFVASFSANANGYWRWKPPSGLPWGTQYFTITVTDPLDGSRTAIATLKFGIMMDRDDGGGGGRSDGGGTTPTLDIRDSLPPKVEQPVDFLFRVLTDENSIFQGSDLSTELLFTEVGERWLGQTETIEYSIVDANDAVVMVRKTEVQLEPGNEYGEIFSLPAYLNAGRYRIRAVLELDRTSLSKEIDFTLRELPLLDLGGGVIVTYNMLTRHLGWIVFFLILLLLLWLFLFLREYWLYLHGDRHITERELQKEGFFT